LELSREMSALCQKQTLSHVYLMSRPRLPAPAAD
jgi:hypothetical protein